MHSYEVLSKEPIIVLSDEFLDKEDCERILNLSIQLEKSTTAMNRIKDYRKSLVTLVDEEWKNYNYRNILKADIIRNTLMQNQKIISRKMNLSLKGSIPSLFI